jgi:hypothetical protein
MKKKDMLDRAIDKILDHYGSTAIQRASLVKPQK